MEKKVCPNCSSADYHHSGYQGATRCNFCNYSTRRPDIKPAIPVPMETVDVNSAEWKARVSAYIAEHGYQCCQSKIKGVHKHDCRQNPREYRTVSHKGD